MKVSRRDFLKYCVGSAAALGLDSSALGTLEKVLAAGGGPPIIWLSAAGCTGCTVSLANRISTSKPLNTAELLINTINLVYHPNLMGAAGDLAVQTLRKAESQKFVLAVEGGIPTAFGGHTCMLFTENGREYTALDVVKELAPKAAAVLAIGTCAGFGGMCGAKPNPTGIKSLSAATGVQTINISGCPTHPDWVVGTIAQLLSGVSVKLDSYRRPTTFFGGSVIHKNCPRQNAYWSSTFGQEGRCLRSVGCKGPSTHGDCPTRQWNNHTNWCIGANAVCLGCTESGFPDRFSPFYKAVLPSDHDRVSGSCTQCHTGPGGDGADDD